jgi:hypothetical protein
MKKMIYTQSSLFSHSLMLHSKYILRICVNVITYDWTMSKCLVLIKSILIAKDVTLESSWVCNSLEYQSNVYYTI